MIYCLLAISHVVQLVKVVMSPRLSLHFYVGLRRILGAEVLKSLVDFSTGILVKG